MWTVHVCCDCAIGCGFAIEWLGFAGCIGAIFSSRLTRAASMLFRTSYPQLNVQHVQHPRGAVLRDVRLVLPVQIPRQVRDVVRRELRRAVHQDDAAGGSKICRTPGDAAAAGGRRGGGEIGNVDAGFEGKNAIKRAYSRGRRWRWGMFMQQTGWWGYAFSLWFWCTRCDFF